MSDYKQNKTWKQMNSHLFSCGMKSYSFHNTLCLKFQIDVKN